MLRQLLTIATTCALLHSTYAANRTVSFDGRALLVDGQRKMLVSGSIHYPRQSVGEWKGIIELAKEAGVNVIETYVFWNIHEEEKGVFDFSGNRDIFKFLELVQEAGLYANLRIGPYVCAEWNNGGIPAWVRDLKGVIMRYNEPAWTGAVSTWVTKLVGMMKERNMFYNQGGPIVLAQIENEFGSHKPVSSKAQISYTQWNFDFARSLNLSIPWIMCTQDYYPTPDDIINTCNNFYCHDWVAGNRAQHPNQPLFYTEMWGGYFQKWGEAKPTRPVEDIAYAVARWFAAGGTLMNYYMLQGGTNFGRTAGGPFITTSYDYNVIIDEFGLKREPDYSHFTTLHQIVHDMSDVLLAVNDPAEPMTIGNSSVASYVYRSEKGCAAFLANGDKTNAATVTFESVTVNVPAWSVTILKDCTTPIYNTAQVKAVVPVKLPEPRELAINDDAWYIYREPLHFTSPNAASFPAPMPHVSITKDTTDYLSLFTTVQSTSAKSTTLVIGKIADIILQVVVNGVFVGETWFKGTSVSYNINLMEGDNEIVLVQSAMGMSNFMRFNAALWDCGINGGTITLDGVDITNNNWLHRVGSHGEQLKLFTKTGSNAVTWNKVGDEKDNDNDDVPNPTMVWFKNENFDVPAALLEFPLALELNGLVRGSVWFNGYHLGRYFDIVAGHVKGCDSCDYRGEYSQDTKCRKGCYSPSQTLYHVPRDWVLPTGNVLTVLEEVGGSPAGVKLVQQVGVQGPSSMSHLRQQQPIVADA